MSSAAANGNTSRSTASHRPRVSTSSIPLSFAYGAPALPSNSSSSRHSRNGRHEAAEEEDDDEVEMVQRSSARSPSGSETSHQASSSTAAAANNTVTASAESRYAKYRQQPEPTASSSSASKTFSQQHQPMPYNPASLSHTSVNIATAFLNAQNAQRRQAQSLSPAASDQQQQQQQAHHLDDYDEEDMDEGGGGNYADQSLEVNVPSSLVSSSKMNQAKRKRQSTAASEDASSSNDEQQTKSNSTRPSKKAARKRKSDQENLAEEGQDVFRKPITPARRRKSLKDPSYRPSQDVDHEEDEDEVSDSDEEEEEEEEAAAQHKTRPRKKKAARVSTVTDGTKTPKVLGAYPTPGMNRQQQLQHQDESGQLDDTFDISSDQTARFRLDPPSDLRDDTSSTNYEAEAEHVRAREEAAAARARGVAAAVFNNPAPHQHQSSAAAGFQASPSYTTEYSRSLPKPRREVHVQQASTSSSGYNHNGIPVPASQKATRNRNLGFEPPPSDSDGFGPTGGSSSGRAARPEFQEQNPNQESPRDFQSAMQAGRKARQLLLTPLRFLAEVFRTLYGHLSKMQWSTLFQGAALVMFVAVLIASMIEDHSWLPRWSSSKDAAKGTTFTAPDMPPGNFEQLVERLAAVERATSELSFQQRDQIASVVADSRTMDSRLSQMSGLITQISDETLRLSASAADISQRQQDGQKHSTTTLATLRNQLDAVSTRLDQFGKTQRLDAATLSSLVQQVESLVSSTSRQDTRLQQLAKKLEEAVKTERVVAIATEAIEQVLPQRLAVRVDPKSGKVHIDPAFWRHLQNAFPNASGGSSSSSGQSTATSPDSWPAFLQANEQNLRSLVESEIQSQASAGAVLNKQAFMDLLKREIKFLKTDFEAKANENVAQIGQEMLLKVDRQLQQHAASASAAASKDAKATGLRLADGGNNNTADVVQSLIDAALLQYSKDVLGRPDYALFTGGARVIPAITSPPLELRPSGLLKRAISLVSGGSGTIRGRPAVTALHPDLTVGSCWAFAGPTAQLGVRLSRKVVVSDITIEHAAKEVAYDVSTAPSDFEVWGIVESEEDARRLAEARATGQAEGQLSSIPPSRHHMLLVTGTYDPNAPHHIQSFPVFGPAASLDIPVSMVMLRVLGTNGGGNGCLYRFRVGGATVE